MNKAQQGKKYKDVSFLYMTKGERKKNKTVIHEFIYLYLCVNFNSSLPLTLVMSYTREVVLERRGNAIILKFIYPLGLPW